MSGLYIHIPFCRHKCAYCDFFSSAGDIQYMEAYVNAIIKEWKIRSNELESDTINTIYIGGGAPSLLPKYLIERLLSELDNSIGLSSLNEFTLEANPEDICPENIKDWSGMGINRISVGVQSFNPVALKTIDRRHSPEASRFALKTLSSCNINYSADLIYGLPNQTLAEWEQELVELLSYNPPHLSAFLISYEQGTRLYAMLEKGFVTEASETTAANMFDILCNKVDKAGYNHYEISNIALPGMEAKHNSSYWDYTPYIGLGTTAHSFDGKLRRFNPAGTKKYINAINNGIACYHIDDENAANRFNDYIITSLRTAKGFDLKLAHYVFGNDLISKFMHNATVLIKSGELSLSRQTSVLRIPRNKWLTSDAIFRELIIE